MNGAVILHHQVHIVFRVAVGLHNVGSAVGHVRHAHMLMSREQDIHRKLLTDAAGQVLIGVREYFPGFYVLLKAPMIDAHQKIAAFLLQRLHGFPCRFQRGCERKIRQVFRLFPYPDPVRDNPEKPDPETVFHHPDSPWPDGQLALPVLHIGAEALRVQGFQMPAQPCPAPVEVMIAERHIVILPVIHGFSHKRRLALAVQIKGQGRTLNGVAPVNHQRIPVFGKAHPQKAHGALPGGCEIGVKQIPMGIRSEIDGQSAHPRASFLRTLVEKISITIISRIMPVRYEPTMLQRLLVMHWIRAAPMPPAPTIPSVVASLTLMSKR